METTKILIKNLEGNSVGTSKALLWGNNAAWLCTAIVEKRLDFMKYLRDNKIESGQIHYRNDRYSVLGGRRDDLPMMDSVEDKYIVLPLNNHLTEAQIEYVCSTIKKGW